MADTYRAVEVSAPGVLQVVERPMREPGAGQVRIRAALWLTDPLPLPCGMNAPDSRSCFGTGHCLASSRVCNTCVDPAERAFRASRPIRKISNLRWLSTAGMFQ